MVTDQDIVCLSSQDWDDLWTRKQRFMQAFARRGNRVLYVEAQASMISVGILRHDWRRAFRWCSGPRRVEENLYVGTLPLVLPGFQMSLAVNRINNIVLGRLLRRWTYRLGFRKPVLWTYNPYSESLVGALDEKLVVYECVDELLASKGLVRRDVVAELERRLIRKADLVIVTHETLYRSKRPLARSIQLIPNGAEVEHFRKAAAPETRVAPELVGMRRPVVGFVGTIQYWIDMELIRFLALAQPEWSFVLIGPIGRLAATEKIQGLANVHTLGRRRYEDLPSYVKGFDVCLNPYVVDETAMSCSPLKLYEYLAAGKPVVSVDMPEARKFDGLVAVGRDYHEIHALLLEAVKGRDADPARIEARMAAVQPHSWDRRFADLEKTLEPILDGGGRS